MIRRLLALLACVALLSALVSGCGADTDGEDGASNDVGNSAVTDGDPATEGEGGAFPVTIEHTYGSTTVERRPERIVTVGMTDHDILLALEVIPVGLTRWYGEYERGVWPWAEDLLGDATPTVLDSAAINYEAVAALEPDLILGLYAGLEQSEYDTLAKIAPTVAQSGDHPNFGTPWQAMTRTAAQAVGKASEGEVLIEGIESKFDAIRTEHPEFDGVGLAYAGVYGDEQYYVETQGSTRVQILLDLGFEVPEELVALGTDHFYYDISAEQLGMLDQDVVLWEPPDPSHAALIEDNELYQSLVVAKEGREVILDDPLISAAMAHSSVLSLPVVLDFLVPELTAAVAKLR